MLSCGIDRVAAKQMMVSVLYGGNKNLGGPLPAWWKPFVSEMQAIHNAVAVKNPDALTKAKEKKGKDAHNFLGSTMSYVMSDLEDRCLQALLEFMTLHKGMTVGVLIFDGLMVDKNEGLTKQCLEEAGEYISSTTGYKLQVLKKPMDEGFQLPPDLPMLCKPRYASTDDEAGYILLRDLEGHVKFCQGITYAHEGYVWIHEEKAVQNFLIRAAMAANIWRVNDHNVAKPYSKMLRHAKDMVITAESKFAVTPAIHDDNFVEKMWHSTVGCVCFSDKLYDMRKHKEFRYEDRPDVMTSLLVPRPLPKRDEQKMKEVHERLLLSTLADEGKVDTYLQIVARATAGMYEDRAACRHAWGAQQREEHTPDRE
jgi:hypothetical protein